MIGGAKVADTSQVHLFDDSGLEKLHESNARMCENQNKKTRFGEVSLSSLIRDLSVPGGLWVSFSSISEYFGDLGCHF